MNKYVIVNNDAPLSLMGIVGRCKFATYQKLVAAVLADEIMIKVVFSEWLVDVSDDLTGEHFSVKIIMSMDMEELEICLTIIVVLNFFAFLLCANREITKWFVLFASVETKIIMWLVFEADFLLFLFQWMYRAGHPLRFMTVFQSISWKLCCNLRNNASYGTGGKLARTYDLQRRNSKIAVSTLLDERGNGLRKPYIHQWKNLLEKTDFA